MLRTSRSLLLGQILAAVTLGCGGAGHVDDTNEDSTDDVAAPDATSSSIDGAILDAQLAPPDAAIDPFVDWGAAGTGCPWATPGTSREVFASRIDLLWNADVSVRQTRAASSLAWSDTGIFDDEFGGLATVHPATDAPAGVFLDVGLGRVVTPYYRTVGGVPQRAPRVCLEGIAGGDTLAAQALTLYTDALTVDSHASAPAITLVVSPGDRIQLYFPTAAAVTIDPDVPSTAPVAVSADQSKVVLGDGANDAYVMVGQADTLTVVPDRR